MWVLLRPHDSEENNRLDIAKSVFQVHGVDAQGKCDPSVEAPLCVAVLPEATALP
jgi:hypothetical protein